MSNKRKLAAGAAMSVMALASMSFAVPALAQSTAGQVQELIVTGTRTPPSHGGLAVQVNDAKDVSVITQRFISTQLPSANVGQLINFLPGVSYSTEDPGGFTSGDLRIHGFDGQHVALTLDGAPLNDTGNYAIYLGEYTNSETIDHMTVNIGSSDVDSPSASAIGATINVVTRTPPQDVGGQAKVSYGSYGYARAYGELDTGVFGPWETRAYIDGEYGRENNFEGRPGDNMRWNIGGKIYQPLEGSDFISLSAIYTSERLYPAYRAYADDLAAFGPWFTGDSYYWTAETARSGVADSPPTNQKYGPNGADTSYWALFPNPVNFASVRGQSQFTLLPNLVFTFDPSFLYTLANGGGETTLKETDARLIGDSGVKGVDLNGDGDILDSVVAYSPSNTQTFRYGVTSSLLWDPVPTQHLQLSYTLDWGHHRQTGEMTYVDPATGNPLSVFGGLPGYGAQIDTADGSHLRTRDRLSIAMLNQIAANYIGQFMDDRLHVNVGFRAPFFERDLNQYCYTYNGSSAWCDTIDPAKVQSAYNADLAANAAPGASAANLTKLLGTSVSTGQGGAPNFMFPFKSSVNYSRVLPNAGVTFRLADRHLVYASYAQGFSAPKTDDLYTSSPELVVPETSDNFAVGYRYQAPALNLSVNFYDTEYKNRIIQSIGPLDPTLSIDRNVGDATVRGVDIEAGWNPIERLTLYGAANFNHSELKSDYYVNISGTSVALPVKGKELVLTPERTFSGRVSYDFGPVQVGAEGKYISKRYISDLNDAWIDGYAVFNADARLILPRTDGKAYVQFNVLNVFDKYYFSRSSTFAAGVNYTDPVSGKTYFGSTPTYYIGAPRTLQVTLAARF